MANGGITRLLGQLTTRASRSTNSRGGRLKSTSLTDLNGTSRSRAGFLSQARRTIHAMTTANGAFIENPIEQGDEVTIPCGTVVHSTHPRRFEYIMPRSMTVTVRYADPGYWVGNRVKLPQVEWVGADGYHRNAQLTPELLRENGITLVTPLGDTDRWEMSA